MNAPVLGTATGSRHGRLFAGERPEAAIGPVHLDLDRLIAARLLIQAQSGGGKSWALRRLLEQTHGRVQHLVLDVEGEFHTLRERHEYVLAARQGGDTVASVRSASLLARRLLEVGASAIVDLYELPPPERIRFVRLFLEALLAAPRDLWHPALVVIDEAHVFCPQAGEAESAGAVVDLMSRGRKRGFCGILATQRLAKLKKDAAAEAGVALIGRATLDVDVRRAAEVLGFTTREDQARLRALKPGEFFAFGPGVSDHVIQVAIGPVDTTHPRPGQRAAAPPPAPAALAAVLKQLADLPQEAETEARTLDELRAKVRALEHDLRSARAGRPAVDEDAVARLRAAARQAEQRAAGAERQTRALEREARAALLDVERAARRLRIAAERTETAPAPVAPPQSELRGIPPAAPLRTAAEPSGERTGPEQRILDAIAWLEAANGRPAQEQVAVAFVAGYTAGGGAFQNPRGRLRALGLIRYTEGRLELTDEGRAAARPPAAALTATEVQTRVLERLPGPEQRILRVLLEAFPAAVENDELARRAGYEPGGGAFQNPRGRLRSLGLVDYPERGKVRAAEVLFLEARP